jgi:hypothetical protein
MIPYSTNFLHYKPNHVYFTLSTMKPLEFRPDKLLQIGDMTHGIITPDGEFLTDLIRQPMWP